MLSLLKAESMEMNIKQKLAENEWKGEIGFTIESREPERVVARMPVSQAAKNPFGTMHAGALIWFADIGATLCAIGDPDSIGEDGSGFPLAVDLHTVLSGNEKAGDLIQPPQRSNAAASLLSFAPMFAAIRDGY